MKMATKKERVNPLLAQEKRKNELEKLKQQAMNTSPVVNDKRVKVTLSMTQEESNKLKKLAIDEGKTVSALVREWMYEKM